MQAAIDKRRHIHLIGICGTAMASLAGMLQLKGHRVTGSDMAAYPPMSDFLRELGIIIAEPFSAKNLDPAPDLVIVGNALSRGNPEVEYILDQRIPFTSLARIIHDEFVAGHESLVVAGTHGKTTTTSMLAWIYEVASRRNPQLAPSFLIGGIAENFGSSFQLRRGGPSSSKATSTTPRFSTKARSSCITSPMRSYSPMSSSIMPIYTAILTR